MPPVKLDRKPCANPGLFLTYQGVKDFGFGFRSWGFTGDLRVKA